MGFNRVVGSQEKRGGEIYERFQKVEGNMAKKKLKKAKSGNKQRQGGNRRKGYGKPGV